PNVVGQIHGSHPAAAELSLDPIAFGQRVGDPEHRVLSGHAVKMWSAGGAGQSGPGVRGAQGALSGAWQNSPDATDSCYTWTGFTAWAGGTGFPSARDPSISWTGFQDL